MTDPILDKLRTGLANGTLVKLTLSEPTGGEEGLRNVYGRVVELREGRRFSLVWRYATRDVTKNVAIEEAEKTIGELLETTFERAHLFTTTGDWKWRRGRPLKAARPTFAVAPSPEHDRPKVKALGGVAFLTALGVTNGEGVARPGMGDKLRQIERFVEVLGHLVADSPLRDVKELCAADLGAGKGYLTFATYEFFRSRGVTARITGVEARKELVALTNQVARNVGFEGLEFTAGTIADFDPKGSLDLLVALHACDTATDDALALGIRSGAALIVTAPCCHRELRPQIAPPPVLEPMLRHGILAGREADLVTDALRALLLEIHGYKASVFEFISPDHTDKNLMIAAHRRSEPRDPAPLRAQLRELMDFHGLREQHLARLLGELE